jgi:hypothetical protein
LIKQQPNFAVSNTGDAEAFGILEPAGGSLSPNGTIVHLRRSIKTYITKRLSIESLLF